MESKQSISELAYQLWNARGRPHGSEEEDWLEAERQLAAAAESDGTGDGAHDGGRDGAVDTSLEETFPASDPPASHLADVPPSNAADKWSAAGKETRTAAPRTASRPTLKPAATAPPVAKAIASPNSGTPPVDETDNGPRTAPDDIGED